ILLCRFASRLTGRQVAPEFGTWSLVVGLAMLAEDDSFDIASDGEISDNTHPAGSEQCNKVVENRIGCRFVADLAITVGIDVELKAFKLDNQWTRDVIDDDGSEIGKAGARAETGVFGYLKVNNVISVFMGVGPGFQFVGSDFIYAISTWDA